MRKRDISICILRAGGTNCDQETRVALESCGVKAKILHMNKAIHEGALHDYHGLVIPGGFSFGDYVRAGAIWGDMIRHELREQIETFVERGRPVLGICNGFQVLAESGVLPGIGRFEDSQSIALAGNIPSGYRCTWTTENDFLYLRHENSGKCIFTRHIPRGKLLRLPIAHAEGRLLFPIGREAELSGRLAAQDQIVFRFSHLDGCSADGEFPFNPNGSALDITAICNNGGNVCGMMPHPERAFFRYQLPDWTSFDGRNAADYADGRLIFDSMIDYISGEISV